MTQSQFESAINTAFSNGTVGAFIMRMHQIVPKKTNTQFADEVYAILTQTTIPLGQTFYIYADPNAQNVDAQGIAKLMISTTPPANVTANQTPNGTPQIYQSSYEVIDCAINPAGELAISDQLFTTELPASAPHISNWAGYDLGNPSNPYYWWFYQGNAPPTLTGSDSSLWIPNSGNNNFLGELNFNSGLQGQTSFMSAN